MYELRVKTHFDAAHRLADYVGACCRHHGHRWEVEIAIQGQELDAKNMLVDFKDVKVALNDVICGYLDHYYLNDTLGSANPTAEFIARWIYERLVDLAQRWDAVIPWIRVWESPECSITYYPNIDLNDEKDVCKNARSVSVD